MCYLLPHVRGHACARRRCASAQVSPAPPTGGGPRHPSGLRRLGINVPEDDLQHMFSLFDTDSSGTLDPQEVGFILEVF